ncbi:hypothetical protein NDU88_005141 [Pleurodeles waltl]|uniref:Uncharacterized protein n=1 Tax=Pleurodeles waltl TaxID=8319 RepID=A0AAV7UH54_PLEWA|nr:hypothetical protein NDU88_005141 [Pleurodeles waltl]
MAAKNKKDDRSLQDMLKKPARGPRVKEDDDRSLDAEKSEGPVTCTFLEALFFSLHEELQVVKRDLYQQNYICFHGVPTAAEGTDLESYMTALFGFLLGDAETLAMKLRVGLLRQAQRPPPTFWYVCMTLA